MQAAKKVLLGISGGIAAYKSAELLRLLVKAGIEVRVVMTPAACAFVQPLTFQALSGNRVYTDIFDADSKSAMDHIELARWADFMLIAPASADCIAKMRQGYADNMLLTLCLAMQSPVAIAPAMNQQMYRNATIKENLHWLDTHGTLIWGPGSGAQACGDFGLGRMLEANHLAQKIQQHFQPGKLEGRRVLVTAGPTREAIDPVRFLSNHSSGKMGYALAQAAKQAGADVILVSGPVHLSPPRDMEYIPVVSAVEMRDAVMQQIDSTDIFIACAAVSDYRIEQVSAQKIKKNTDTRTLMLVQNPDIVRMVNSRDNPPFSLGFAAETENIEQQAADKRMAKNLDLIAVNQVGVAATGFDSDQNELIILGANLRQHLPLAHKTTLAHAVIDLLADQYLSSSRNSDASKREKNDFNPA